MTPEQVHAVAFRKPPIGHRGYDEPAVDDFLDRIAATLAGTPKITREELTSVKFRKPPIGRRGYSEDEVDAFLQRVIAEWPGA